jgi:hypothetical protein
MVIQIRKKLDRMLQVGKHLGAHRDSISNDRW